MARFFYPEPYTRAMGQFYGCCMAQFRVTPCIKRGDHLLDSTLALRQVSAFLLTTVPAAARQYYFVVILLSRWKSGDSTVRRCKSRA